MRYGLIKRLKKGITLCIKLTFECNLDCEYCILKAGNKNLPKNTTLKNWHEWMEFIETFPIKVREVFLSGGEVTEYSEIITLANRLIDDGYCVTIFTNGMDIEPFMHITKSKRLRFYLSYHKKIDKNIKRLKTRHRVDVTGFCNSEIVEFKKKLKDLPSKDTIKNRIRVGVDGLIFTNCYDRAIYYHKLGKNESKR